MCSVTAVSRHCRVGISGHASVLAIAATIPQFRARVTGQPSRPGRARDRHRERRSRRCTFVFGSCGGGSGLGSDPVSASETIAVARSSNEASSPSTATVDHVVPERIDRYRVLRTLGIGGQGVVYEAHDPELDRRVAIKLIRAGSGRRHATRRLLREANALAQLSHPNVVGVHDVGQCDEGIYIVTQLVEGATLADWLRAPRTWREIVRVFAAAGRGLLAAHEHAIVHRDFKPANVLVAGDSVVRLVDFGLARGAGHDDGSAPRGAWWESTGRSLTLDG
jgi:hypothetical protein